MAKITVLDRSGHRTIEYNRTDAADVQRADDLLQEVLGRGWLAYRDDTRTVVKHVEPDAESITVIPQIAGG